MSAAEPDKILRIRGLTYSPTEKGVDLRSHTVWGSHLRDIDLMKEMGVRVIRTYYPITSKAFLDKLAENGIKVIVGFPYFDNTRNRGPDMLGGGYIDYIKKHKDHPAILMWSFGNDYNDLEREFDNDVDNWYAALKEAARRTKEIDPSRKVTTAHGGMPSREVVKRFVKDGVSLIDVWGVNFYENDHIEKAFEEWKGILADKDIPESLQWYISETGTDSFDGRAGRESQPMQASVVERTWKKIVAHADGKSFLGATFMTFSDEWWKAGRPDRHETSGRAFSIPEDMEVNEEWWGVVDINRNPKEAFYALRKLWTGKEAPEPAKRQTEPSKVSESGAVPSAKQDLAEGWSARQRREALKQMDKLKVEIRELEHSLDIPRKISEAIEDKALGVGPEVKGILELGRKGRALFGGIQKDNFLVVRKDDVSYYVTGREMALDLDSIRAEAKQVMLFGMGNRKLARIYLGTEMVYSDWEQVMGEGVSRIYPMKADASPDTDALIARSLTQRDDAVAGKPAVVVRKDYLNPRGRVYKSRSEAYLKEDVSKKMWEQANDAGTFDIKNTRIYYFYGNEKGSFNARYGKPDNGEAWVMRRDAKTGDLLKDEHIASGRTLGHDPLTGSVTAEITSHKFKVLGADGVLRNLVWQEVLDAGGNKEFKYDGLVNAAGGFERTHVTEYYRSPVLGLDHKPLWEASTYLYDAKKPGSRGILWKATEVLKVDPDTGAVTDEAVDYLNGPVWQGLKDADDRPVKKYEGIRVFLRGEKVYQSTRTGDAAGASGLVPVKENERIGDLHKSGRGVEIRGGNMRQGSCAGGSPSRITITLASAATRSRRRKKPTF